MNYLLIKPGQRILYDTVKLNSPALEPPFWPLLHGSYLEKLNQRVKIIDLEVNSQEELISELCKQQNYVILYASGHNPSASIANMVGMSDLCKLIKVYNDEAVIVLHGLYPTSVPNKVLDEFPDIDIILCGEGFDFFNEKYNDINEIPPVDWSLIDINKYRAHNWHCFGDIENRSPYGIIFSSLGCPFSCDFCCINIMHREVQLRDMDLVFRDIKNLYDLGIRNIKIHDELFVMNKKRVLDLCYRIIDAGMGDLLNMWAYARTDSIDAKLVKTMLEAGIHWLGIGYESGSQAILNSSDKKQKISKAYKATEICKNEGMNVCGNFVFGLVNDTMETMEATLKLSMDLLPEWANFNVVFAFPGTRLYDKVKDQPWFHKSELYEEYSQHGYYCCPTGSKYLIPKQVLEFKDEAFRQFYQNPKYLEMIENKFGIETKEYVENNLVYYPKRKLLDNG